MSLELVKEDILLNNKVGNESSQLLLEGDIIVPDIKPDISSILRAEGKVILEDEKVSDDRVSFKGELKVILLYQAKKAEKLIHSMVAGIPFEDFINIEGLTKDSQVTLRAKLEHLEYKVINDRKINVKAVVTIYAQVDNEVKHEVIKDVSDMPDMQIIKGNLMVNNTVENKKDRFVVKEDLSLPAGKPNIREVLQTDIMVCDKEIKAMDGKVLVKGTLLVSTLYIGDNDESLIEIVEYEVPFNGFIEAKNAQESMLANGTLTVADQSIQAIPDEDGEDRKLDMEATIGANIRVTENENIELVEDAYCINQGLNISRDSIKYPEFVGKNKNKSSIKETIVIDGKYPDIMQVCKVWGTVSLDDVRLTDDLLIAEGVVNLEVLYIGKNDSEPVGVVPVSIPFEQEIEVKGARSDMEVDVSAEIENISFSMLGDREVEVRVTLGFDVFVVQQKDGTIITDLLVTENGKEEFEELASAAIYVVQKGDTLWKIAKKYNTTVDDLVQINEIENPDRIYTGQKLLVLKRISE